jgi:ubiquitin-like domain-containing CTD phosphatase 1
MDATPTDQPITPEDVSALLSDDAQTIVTQSGRELSPVEILSAASDDPSILGAEDVKEAWVHLEFKWNQKSFEVDLAESDRVFDLKDKLYKLTNVPAERQKILGLVKGKLPPDEATIADLKLPSGKKFSLVGTPIGEELKDASELLDLPDVFNDFDIDLLADPKAALMAMNDQRNVRKVQEATRALKLDIINPPREGKNLLVLDLDYTILDTKPLTSGALPPAECARPGLHMFLEAVYPYYDICIWSQTSWIWLETKLVELEMIGSDRPYKISFVLDKSPMFTVFSQRNGKTFQHSVKALKIIWNKFPQWSAKNTIHIDDLSRNFALNPSAGLKILPFKDCHTARAQQDRELERLMRYLLHLAEVGDFSRFDHRNWKRVTAKLPPLSNAVASAGSSLATTSQEAESSEPAGDSSSPQNQDQEPPQPPPAP